MSNQRLLARASGGQAPRQALAEEWRPPEHVSVQALEHRLEGLEPTNLLAFLALLGVMRALARARPEWHARVRWDPDSFPLRPVLCLGEERSAIEIAQSVVRGCDALGADYDFGGAKLLKWSQTEARSLMRRAVRLGPSGRGRADLLSALASDAAVAHGSVVGTCFCLMWGQGYQFFLERLARAPRWQWPRRAVRRGKQLVLDPVQMILQALFRSWRRVDHSPAFRWDHVEDRRHALRAFDPQGSAILTVSGANTLAAVGLPELTVVPVSLRGRIGIRTVGVRAVDWQHQVTWPIWTRAASLPAVRALLSHPALAAEKPEPAQLAALGVIELQRARRIQCGKYFNFVEAETVLIG